MTRIRKLTLTFLLLLPAPLASIAKQKLHEVEGTYEYYLPRNEARDKGEQTALERAMLSAMADEFGTLVSQHTLMNTHVSDDRESLDYWSTAALAVRSEWVETLGKPSFGIRLDGDDIVITCTVRGKARPISAGKADVAVRILRNDPQTEANTFAEGDHIMVRFSSAVDGYLTIFLQGDDGMVYRMLPFYHQREGSMKVDGGQDYLLFSSTAGDAEQYELRTDKALERNTLYFIFSPNEYTKPIDSRAATDTGLRELTATAFRRWLDTRRAADPSLQVVLRPISITHK